ncbi:DUF3365 domain-containing protein [bacterium]|nr:DUF3365 domain-containing protein [bacterium]
MRTPSRPLAITMALLASAAVAWASFSPVVAAEKKEKKDPAVERTRKTVRMLDDLYKTVVVLITEHYVNETDDLAAGSAAVALFDAMKKKGWHEVRLIDVTGEPYNEDNVAKDAFEKEAVSKMKAGEAWYDEVQEKDGKRILRAATPIPVVMEKCTMCHPHYKDAKKGAAIGLLSYTIAVE